VSDTIGLDANGAAGSVSINGGAASSEYAERDPDVRRPTAAAAFRRCGLTMTT